MIFFSSVSRRVVAYARKHPFISGALTLVVAGVLYWGWGVLTPASTQVRYVMGNVATGTIVASLQESGQVASNNTLSITPQASGQILYIGVKPGDRVAQGTLVAEIDPTNAQKALRDAQANLASAQLSLQKLQEPATPLSLSQAQNSLATAYSNSGSDLASTFLDLPSVMTGLADVNFGFETNKAQQWNIDWYDNAAAKYDQVDAQTYRDAAYAAYNAAKASYDQTFADYQAVNIATADATTTVRMLDETYKTLVVVQGAVKATNTLIQFYSDKMTEQNATPAAIASTQISTLAGYTSKLSTHTSTLFNDSSSITNDKLSLEQLQQGADAIDLASAQLNVQKAQNAVTDARATLDECYVRAPFAGTIGSVSASAYAQASAGTTLATLITSQQYAQLSVNEVDAAKLALGQHATLTFDAIPSLTLTGTVASIDQVGAVSQGVVSYTVKIGFDSQDQRIKPGMTTNAAIETGVATDALVVPQAAVKAQGGQSYVLAFSPAISQADIAAAGSQGVLTTQTPVQLPVTTGLSDNTNIQILSGLAAGEQVVVGTRSGAAKTTTTTTSSSSGSNRSFGPSGGAVLRGL
jgi:RND family efflux transporter MFP subunit